MRSIGNVTWRGDSSTSYCCAWCKRAAVPSDHLKPSRRRKFGEATGRHIGAAYSTKDVGPQGSEPRGGPLARYYRRFPRESEVHPVLALVTNLCCSCFGPTPCEKCWVSYGTCSGSGELRAPSQSRDCHEDSGEPHIHRLLQPVVVLWGAETISGRPGGAPARRG
ncbi:Piso0_005366 [Millerozyma farinosa CBS 7064]|uniref:Piso0_005366 protein n=1 Tax=Pichia sorbitophila (strain ATCC MYA-4447 / BCRC 22081 / CBS 7064 / NBRC 10061 / NRRL Y-12695) TaxID=559304 RepID=G8Y4X3_PICSO|nr:Piso0_005366 [Millerozyma farinosa CBS 7064]